MRAIFPELKNDRYGKRVNTKIKDQVTHPEYIDRDMIVPTIVIMLQLLISYKH